MVTDIISSFGNCLDTLGYEVRYSIGDKGNSTKLPLAEMDMKTSQVAVFQTVSNINKLDFDLMLYHAQAKTDAETLSDLSNLVEFETIKKTLNQSLRNWNISTSISIPGHYGLTWSYQGQGINKEFAANKPVKMIVLNCSLQYTDQ
jgi:hypothetical protein